jgi:hypothetical protein
LSPIICHLPDGGGATINAQALHEFSHERKELLDRNNGTNSRRIPSLAIRRARISRAGLAYHIRLNQLPQFIESLPQRRCNPRIACKGDPLLGALQISLRGPEPHNQFEVGEAGVQPFAQVSGVRDRRRRQC